ncbi:N-formylglutamate deformylase [Jiella avicenniae]|uniref:N-formylglutamate deformylase n=1 Tax=Jiella avicenniae TaxID=2907202 RepID=A0A9X1NZ72_9HYPH|nr:N-formylglutamate deformylase [Jiella avicenniae]MCE7027593.1 N-formylglutamate deformylase [Jiella avicenniae]
MSDWLTIRRGNAPLLVSLPHTGTEIPSRFQDGLVSLWLARRDADWWIEKLYAFTGDLDATIVHTAISRTVIDVNRDPSGVSLYPGQATTELCPTTTFDGEPLYEPGKEPDDAEIGRRKALYHAPYHAALQAEIARLRDIHPQIVVYDCHSIRSVIPRLFDGELPQFNIGTNSGASCARALQAEIERIAAASGLSWVSNGRFKGGAITRVLGDPDAGVHAVQMELACRGYMDEPEQPSPGNWPTPYDPARAAPLLFILQTMIGACLAFADPAR